VEANAALQERCAGIRAEYWFAQTRRPRYHTRLSLIMVIFDVAATPESSIRCLDVNERIFRSLVMQYSS
jgi:hypothetical protein